MVFGSEGAAATTGYNEKISVDRVVEQLIPRLDSLFTFKKSLNVVHVLMQKCVTSGHTRAHHVHLAESSLKVSIRPVLQPNHISFIGKLDEDPTNARPRGTRCSLGFPRFDRPTWTPPHVMEIIEEQNIRLEK